MRVFARKTGHHPLPAKYSISSLAFCLLIATLILLTAPSFSHAATLKKLSSSELNKLETALSEQAQELGSQLIDLDSETELAARERAVANERLEQALVDIYRSGRITDTPLLAALGGEGLRARWNNLQLLQQISAYRVKTVDAVAQSEARLQVNQAKRAQLISSLNGAQLRLARVHEESMRREQIAAERAAAKADREAKKRAAQESQNRAVQQQGQLVAGGSSMPISAQMIDAYLASKGSPMTGQGFAFVQSGARWRIDPRLLVAISGAESNFGQITCGPHNAWGWACPNNPADFATWAHGIETVTSGLRRWYLDEGRTSVALIQQKYAPSGAANDPTGLNNHWVANVTKFLTELGGNPYQVGPGPALSSVAPDIGGLGLPNQR